MTRHVEPSIEDKRQPSSSQLGRLKALGVRSWAELPFHLPRRFKDYSVLCRSFAEARERAEKKPTVCLRLTVRSVAAYDRTGNRLDAPHAERPFRLFIIAADAVGETGRIAVFGNTFPWRGVASGAEISVAGQLSIWNGHWQLRNPELIREQDVGRIVPVYRQKPGYLASPTIAAGIVYALERHLGDTVALLSDATGLPESQLDRLLQYRGGVRGALLASHEPRTLQEANAAHTCMRRLAAAQILARAAAVRERTNVEASIIPVEPASVERIVSALPVRLTKDQRNAIDQIVGDLRAPRPMRRLLTGDVGCGKSLCFQVPAALVHFLGKKVGVLAPNQLLAEQLAAECAAIGASTVELVTADRKPTNPHDDPARILVGTTALLPWAKAEGYVPDLLIVDEQHKQSREIREALLWPHTNLLEVSATPIPRSLALVTHAGMDVSMLRESPVRKQIETRIVTGIEEARLIDFVRRALEAGWRTAVVYGRIEDEGMREVRSVEAELSAWERRFPGKVGVVHGRMSEEEKAAVIRRLRAGELSLLVASTVLELGLTLPSLRAVVVVVNAELFGLATLHQLRGRIAREGGRGKFLMFLPKDVSEDARKRLEALVATSDGFKLAELDMRMRGFGDLSEDSELQTGASESLFVGITVTPSDLEEANRLLQSLRSS